MEASTVIKNSRHKDSGMYKRATKNLEAIKEE